MSWFDASGFASLAKSALKEAQKTIDKALDIKEEEPKVTSTPVIDDANFFAAWGIKNDNANSTSTISKQDTSIWGSFTGSFFENPKAPDDTMSRKSFQSSGSLSEISETSGYNAVISSKSLPEKLAQYQSEKDALTSQIKSPENQLTAEDNQRLVEDVNETWNSNFKTDSETDSSGNGEKQEYVAKMINRVSIMSSESDKKSSESVEILGSRSATSTDCTTTPDSEVVSPSDSLSPSTLDPKKTSESVEILPDSLVTSPSSVEVLEDCSKTESPFLSPIGFYTESSDAMTTSIEPESSLILQDSSSDISPYASPMEESKTPGLEDSDDTIVASQLPIPLSSSAEKSSPLAALDNIQSTDELDDVSQAEDSYTSASESTVMTIMETIHQQFDQSKGRMYDSCSEPSKSVNLTPISSSQLELNLDAKKDVKQSFHLAVEPITTQPIRKTDNLTEKTDCLDSELMKNTIVEPLEPPAAFFDQEKSINQEFSGHDQHSTTILTDSSCEGTLIESSEDNLAIKNAKRVGADDGILTSSAYVKNMLADAMVEKCEVVEQLERQDIPHRENSPISSESRSDLVKIGSDQASGHTSGDELETTTSSDIEIISRYSPNGDSSSTQSRQSPANLHSGKSGDLLTKTLKTRGHSRELSEISIGSDDGCNEVDRLRRRIQEMNEILEVRESKLIDVSRMNIDLHEQNNHLKVQLENWEKRALQHQDLHVITDEYTQRMSALEKKFQQTIRERDALKDQLEMLKQNLSSQSSLANVEKDEIIKQLREEGEKLSKQQLQHSNIIKRLRVKEKENEATVKSLTEQLEEQNLELDRLKRSLYAKEEIERSQIEAVHTLTARVKKQEKELTTLQEKYDNTLHKMNAYKTSLDAAKAELMETKSNCSAAEEELKRVLDTVGESCRLAAQVEDLKIKLKHEEENHVKKIDSLKQENNDLLKRLEAAETRSEELSESISLATKPLIRQLEQLQANLAYKSNTFMKQEKVMTDKIDELQTKLENMASTDRTLVEENINLKTKISTLEAQAKRSETDRLEMEKLYEQEKCEKSGLLNEIEQLKLQIASLEKSHRDEIKELKREIESLRDKLSTEKAAIDAEKRKNNNTSEQQPNTVDENRASPTSSLRRDSISSTNSVWLTFNDSIFDTSSGRFPNVYDGLRTNSNTSTIETLQAQLKAREGEIQTLQWEMSRRNVERDALNIELSSLSMKVEELTTKLNEVEALNANLSEIQTRYDALLQMYGEKVEETQELQLDLEDVKEMYKSQIDQLLKRDS